MKKINLYDIYEIGKELSLIRGISPDEKISSYIFPLWFVRVTLENICGDNSIFLEASRRAASKLLHTISATIPEKDGEVVSIDKQKEFSFHASSITTALSQFETVLGNDMLGISSYVVSKKGIYNTSDLISHADEIFPTDIRSLIPKQTNKDLVEAGKCLAFELSTACSFHLWRAVESVMLSYYKELAANSCTNEKAGKNWAAYIKALEEKGANTNIIKFLDHIRTEYRNPQTHPNDMLEVNEALGLFGVATSAIQQMILEIQKLKELKKPTTKK